ncbi:MAG: DUF2157 domain-containing protein [Cyanobacteria bacterium SIG27]|nr:DUF2157 domain-containing protein [Cyanobacteria bacterium SIG27]
MEKRITRWLEKGLIDKQTALALLKEAKEEKAKNHKLKLNIAIYTTSIVLIGMGIISFIAANDWILQLFNKFEILKIILMLILTSASLLGGYHLAYEKKNYPRLGNALVFLSTLLIGGTYALIGQTYNINANNSGLMFMWLISVVPLAYLYKSKAINFLSIVLYILGICFYFGDISSRMSINALYVPLIVGTSLYTIGNIPFILNKFNKFSLNYKLIGLVPIFWIFLAATCADDTSIRCDEPVYFITLFMVLALNFVNFFINKFDKNGNLLKIETGFIATVLLFLLMLISIPNFGGIFIMLLAHIFIITIITYGYNYGYKFKDAKIVGIVNWFLVIYLTLNYCRWSWNFMEKTLFFLIGGFALLSLGIFLERKQRGLKQ